MYKALVIGLGNIGAGYDFDNEQILTHTKAYYLDSRFVLSIYDTDKTVSEKISAKYNCDVEDFIDKQSLSKFDIISVCTPTDTHFQLLKDAIQANVKVIICEKPVSSNLDELNTIKSLYHNGTSKILVNYIRRFQRPYNDLRLKILEILSKEKLTNISVRYQRGFVNNCSHAFDTIEFLTDSQIVLTEIKKHNVLFDHFKSDPTLSLQAKWGETNVSITGLSNVSFSYFEFDLYFEYHRVYIKNGGQNIEIYFAASGQKVLQPLLLQEKFTKDRCLRDYMKNVIDQCYMLLKDKTINDNFLQAISLNQKMLNYINY